MQFNENDTHRIMIIEYMWRGATRVYDYRHAEKPNENFCGKLNVYNIARSALLSAARHGTVVVAAPAPTPTLYGDSADTN